MSYRPDPLPEGIAIERRAHGEVVVRHLPTGITVTCRRHPVSTMNEDEALRELAEELATRPD